MTCQTMWAIAAVSVVVVFVISIVVSTLTYRARQKKRDEGMAARGWIRAKETAPPAYKEWYKASDTCEGCKFRRGDECHKGATISIVTVDDVTKVEIGRGVWPKVGRACWCGFYESDCCPNCRGTKHVKDVELSLSMGTMVTTGWWTPCKKCGGTGRMKEHVT